jgi:anthranilate 1,2-dioxygenase large subunit
MRNIRLKQANLVGPAGFISLEDGHAIELVQQAIVRDKEACSFIEFGGRDVASQDNLVTETAIRGFWQYYRRLMGFN